MNFNCCRFYKIHIHPKAQTLETSRVFLIEPHSKIQTYDFWVDVTQRRQALANRAALGSLMKFFFSYLNNQIVTERSNLITTHPTYLEFIGQGSYFFNFLEKVFPFYVPFMELSKITIID